MSKLEGEGLGIIRRSSKLSTHQPTNLPPALLLGLQIRKMFSDLILYESAVSLKGIRIICTGSFWRCYKLTSITVLKSI